MLQFILRLTRPLFKNTAATDTLHGHTLTAWHLRRHALLPVRAFDLTLSSSTPLFTTTPALAGLYTLRVRVARLHAFCSDHRRDHATTRSDGSRTDGARCAHIFAPSCTPPPPRRSTDLLHFFSLRAPGLVQRFDACACQAAPHLPDFPTPSLHRHAPRLTPYHTYLFRALRAFCHTGLNVRNGTPTRSPPGMGGSHLPPFTSRTYRCVTFRCHFPLFSLLPRHGRGLWCFRHPTTLGGGYVWKIGHAPKGTWHRAFPAYKHGALPRRTAPLPAPPCRTAFFANKADFVTAFYARSPTAATAHPPHHTHTLLRAH